MRACVPAALRGRALARRCFASAHASVHVCVCGGQDTGTSRAVDALRLQTDAEIAVLK